VRNTRPPQTSRQRSPASRVLNSTVLRRRVQPPSIVRSQQKPPTSVKHGDPTVRHGVRARDVRRCRSARFHSRCQPLHARGVAAMYATCGNRYNPARRVRHSIYGEGSMPAGECSVFSSDPDRYHRHRLLQDEYVQTALRIYHSSKCCMARGSTVRYIVGATERRLVIISLFREIASQARDSQYARIINGQIVRTVFHRFAAHGEQDGSICRDTS